MTGLSVQAVMDSGAPRVVVAVDGLDGSTPSKVSVERSSDGKSWEPVLGGWLAQAVGAFQVTDHIAPLNVELAYRLTVDGPTVPDDLAASIRLDSDQPWLQDPLDPVTAVPVGVGRRPGEQWLAGGTLSQATYTAGMDVSAVAGATLPVASAGNRLAGASIPLAITCPKTSIHAVRALLAGGGPIVIRGFDHPLVEPGAWLAVGDVTATLFGIAQTWCEWSMTCQQVAPLSPHVVPAWITYDQMAAALQAVGIVNTYDALAAAAADAGIVYAALTSWLRGAA